MKEQQVCAQALRPMGTVSGISVESGGSGLHGAADPTWHPGPVGHF